MAYSTRLLHEATPAKNALLIIVESGVLANMGYSGDNGWLDGAVLELLGIPARADCSDCILDDKSRP